MSGHSMMPAFWNILRAFPVSKILCMYYLLMTISALCDTVFLPMMRGISRAGETRIVSPHEAIGDTIILIHTWSATVAQWENLTVCPLRGFFFGLIAHTVRGAAKSSQAH